MQNVTEFDDEARRMLMRNTPVLVFFTALFVVSYVWAYVSIVRFKVPSWPRR